MKSKETKFERNLEESFDAFDRTVGKYLTLKEVMDAFFPNKVAKMIGPYIPDSDKNAIILVGPSCAGKTTAALEFVKLYKDFVIVSMDKCAAEELEGMNEVDLFNMRFEADDLTRSKLGNRRFGQMLEAGHKNIIVDGNWMHINARGALLKTLDSEGYKTTIILVYPTPEEMLKRIERRICDVIAANLTGIPIAEHMNGVNLPREFADKIGVTEEEARAIIMSCREFKIRYDLEVRKIQDELDNSNFQNQIDCSTILLGTDQVSEIIIG